MTSLNYHWTPKGYRFYDEVTGEDVATATVADGNEGRTIWKVDLVGTKLADWQIPEFRDHNAMLHYMGAFWMETVRLRADGVIQVPPVEYIEQALTTEQQQAAHDEYNRHNV